MVMLSDGTAALCSLTAAILWWRASRVEIPRFPDVGFDSDSVVFDPIRDALGMSSRRNAIAASFSGLAALAATLSFGLRLAGIS